MHCLSLYILKLLYMDWKKERYKISFRGWNQKIQKVNVIAYIRKYVNYALFKVVYTKNSCLCMDRC